MLMVVGFAVAGSVPPISTARCCTSLAKVPVCARRARATIGCCACWLALDSLHSAFLEMMILRCWMRSALCCDRVGTIGYARPILLLSAGGG